MAMGKTNFDRLLKRYLTGQVSESERIKIEAWLEVMKTEDTKSLELSKEDEERLFQKIVSQKDNLKEIESFKPFKAVSREISRSGWILRIAASIAAVVLIIYSLQNFSGGDGLFRYSAKSDIEKVLLNDGTIAWLKKGSSLVYYDKSKDGIRYTELDGEALFEVAKDPAHPFLIKCSGATVKVLGTSFRLKADGNEILLKVLTGKVNLSTRSNAKGIDVDPNQKATVNSKGVIEKHAMQSEEINDVAKGTEYIMGFNDVPLGEVLKRLEGKFEILFRIDNEQSTHCHVTADLTDQSLERSLETLQEILKVTFQKNGNVITVSGAGC
jgi:transmembrane sensor